MINENVEALCQKCGQPFTMFLQEMAAQNLIVVCPRCAAEQDCGPATAIAESA
jgi:DNA-directed RNA polymerase subunit RPC12/RpoP